MEFLDQEQTVSVLKANIAELKELYSATPEPIARARILERLAKQLVRLDTARKTPKI